MKWKYSRRALLLLLALQCFGKAGAQIIRIIDQSSQRPIPDVFIYHENQKAASFTDVLGKADISEFPPDGKIILQHPSYDNFETNREALEDQQFVIFLKEGIQHYEGIVISASKWEQKSDEVANDVLSIKSKEIAFTNPPTSAEILSNSGQVYVQKSQLGGGSPTIRGFAANAVLLVVDGIRLNNAIYRSGNLQNVINIDPNIVDRSEVVFGPGSVMYGSDALGGVMDFKTKNPRWSFSGKTEMSANGMIRYGSAAEEKTGHFDVSIAQEKISYFGSITFTDFEDLKAGSRRSDDFEGYFLRNTYAGRQNNRDVLISNDQPNKQISSGYDLINALQKVRWRTSDRTDFTYSYFISTTSNIPRYDRLTQPLSDGSDSLLNAEWYYGPQTWQMHSLRFSSFAPTNLYDEMQTTLAFQRYEESRHDRRFGDDRLRNRKEEVDVITFNLDFEKSLKNNTLFYGIDGFWNGVESQAQRRNILTDEITTASTRYPNEGSQYYSGAIYGNYFWRLSDQWVMQTGARFSVVRLTAENDDEDAGQVQAENFGTTPVPLLENIEFTNEAITGSFSLIYSPKDGTKISGIVSSGFRAPNIDDVGKLFEIDNETIIIPNTELKPEYSYNQEVGFQQEFGSLVKLKFVGYHSILTNAIVRDEIDFEGAEFLTFEGEQLSLRAQVNGGNTRRYGGTAKVDLDLNKSWKFSSTLNINEGEEIETNEDIRHATPIFGRSSVQFSQGPFRSEFFIDYAGARDRDDILIPKL